MKMNKSLIALCLSAGLLASAPGISLADVNYVPQNTSDAPAIPITLAQQWQAGDSIWSRPAIRVFATYAKWDENWGYDYTGSSSTNPYYGKADSRRACQ